MHRVTSSFLCISWNVNINPSLNHFHILIKGEPIYLYLFIVFMEILCISIPDDARSDSWKPSCISFNGLPLSHILFENEVYVFSKDKKSQIIYIANHFDLFSRASSMKIKPAKSPGPKFNNSLPSQASSTSQL